MTRTFLATYIGLFALLLVLFETRVKYTEDAIRRLFGFMFSYMGACVQGRDRAPQGGSRGPCPVVGRHPAPTPAFASHWECGLLPPAPSTTHPQAAPCS